MNIVNSYALKSLQKNKTRTLVTIIGIILSASMISAVATFAYSMQQYMLETTVFNDGDWYGGFLSADREKVDNFLADDTLCDISIMQYRGFAKHGGVYGKSDYMPYLYVAGSNETGFEKMSVRLSEGRLPENPSELIVSDELASSAGVYYKIGDKITLELGDRENSEGKQLGNSEEFLGWAGNEGNIRGDSEGESFLPKKQCEYTVVGSFSAASIIDSEWGGGFLCLTTYDENDTLALCDVFFKTVKGSEFYTYFDNYQRGGEELVKVTNRSLLAYSGITRHESFYKVLYGLCAVLILLIMFGSVSLIYNAFAISVSERTKQLGILASVGATKKQLRKSVLFEAFCVSAVGIPLGIGAGIGGMATVIFFLGDKFASMYAGEIVSDMRVSVNLPSIAIAAALALATVLISAWIPANRAMKISPIEALRQTKDIKLNAKKLRASALTERLFGFEGSIAVKNFKRNKKRYNVTIASLFMSIVLFISSGSLCEYLTNATGTFVDVKSYDISYFTDKSNGEIYNELRRVDGITESVRVSFDVAYIELDRNLYNDDYVEYIRNLGGTQVDAETAIERHSATAVIYVEDAAFERFLDENKLDKQLYMNPNKPVGVMCATFNDMDYDNDRLNSFDMFNVDSFDAVLSQVKAGGAYESLEASDKERMTYDADYYAGDSDWDSDDKGAYTLETKITIGAIVPKLVMGADEISGIGGAIMYPESAAKALGLIESSHSESYYFRSDNWRGSYDEMNTILTAEQLPTDGLNETRSGDELERNIVLIVRVLSLGFITLISLISAANVFNTVSTSISLRRRELAMLDSVGMTKRGFTKMMLLECLIYGMKSLVLGIPVAIAVTIGVFRIISEGVSVAFYIPPVPVIVSVFCVFAVVAASMLYAVKKLRKENTVDALKNENS